MMITFNGSPAGVEPAPGREARSTPEADTLNKKGGWPSEHYRLPPLDRLKTGQPPTQQTLVVICVACSNTTLCLVLLS